MDVTFVLEESGVTATVDVPCDANVAEAKRVACTEFAVSPASVEMRIGTEVVEGTCRLQDTAFGGGVQVVLARPRLADIKCPAECSVEERPPGRQMRVDRLSLSPCGALCLLVHLTQQESYVTGFDTETFIPAFRFKLDCRIYDVPAISRCKTRCYMTCKEGTHEVALPGGEVLRKVDSSCYVFACGGVVVSHGEGGVSVYDEDLTLLRSISHKGCAYLRRNVAVSDCGGWMISPADKEWNVRLWDLNTGEAVACVPAYGMRVALSRSASVFAVMCFDRVRLYDWSGLTIFEKKQRLICDVQFTPCGKYVVFECMSEEIFRKESTLHQYDVATMSCVRTFSDVASYAFAISPCSRMIVITNLRRDTIETRHLHPY